jgi:hypothetical protein
MMKLKRIGYIYCLVAVLLLTPFPKYFGMWLFYVQIAHLVVMLTIGFSKGFTLFDI